MATILVIDDSMLIRQQVSRALTTAGFTVVLAEDGQDALEKLAKTPDIAAAVCDINMPRMNGLEFLEQVGTKLSVVVLTTEGEPDLVIRARELGAKGWILKPFKPEIHVAAARKLVA